jgi:hypothetical protein
MGSLRPLVKLNLGLLAFIVVLILCVLRSEDWRKHR